MLASPHAQSQPSHRKLVAPLWHTLLLVLVFLAITVVGALFQRQARSQPGMLQPHPRVAPLYLSIIAAEWGLVYYIWAGGLRQTGTRWRDLIGGRWKNGKDVLVDIALALGLWALWIVVQVMAQRVRGPNPARPVSVLFPQGTLETLLWVVLALTAGFCEEVVFRGYFQNQFYVLTRSGGIAVLLQAALFGVSHGYQGMRPVLMITVFGALYGLLALWRRSLRPGMITHAWSDIFGVVIFRGM